MEFKDRLKFLREQKKWSKIETAKKIGVSYSAYSNYEYGNREPNQNILKKISEVFNTSISYLVSGKKDITDMSETELIKIMNEFAHEVPKFNDLTEKPTSFSDSMNSLSHKGTKSDMKTLELSKKITFPKASIAQIDFLIASEELVNSGNIDSNSPIYSDLINIIELLANEELINIKKKELLKGYFDNIVNELN